MRIELGDHLVLRPLVAGDLDALLALDHAPNVLRYITGGAPTTRSTYEGGLLDRMLAPGAADARLGFFALEQGGAFLGWLHLRPDRFEQAWLELGYRLRPEVWGRGLATRASLALIAHAEHHWPGRGLSARAMTENAASRRVMEKVGLSYAGDFTYPAARVGDLDLPEVAAVLYRRIGARLAHDPGGVDLLRAPTDAAPWRVLVSGCLMAWPCGVNADDYGLGAAFAWRSTPRVTFVPFCPEQHSLGAPRAMPDLHGGDGFGALDGTARVRAPDGADLTDAMVRGAEAMVRAARDAGVDFAVLTDMSAACGTQVISDGCRFDEPRRYRRGLGVAAAALVRAGIPVIAQRDFRTLAQLAARAGGPPVDAALRDHHDHPWVLEHLPEGPWR